MPNETTIDESRFCETGEIVDDALIVLISGPTVSLFQERDVDSLEPSPWVKCVMSLRAAMRVKGPTAQRFAREMRETGTALSAVIDASRLTDLRQYWTVLVTDRAYQTVTVRIPTTKRGELERALQTIDGTIVSG